MDHTLPVGRGDGEGEDWSTNIICQGYEI